MVVLLLLLDDHDNSSSQIKKKEDEVIVVLHFFLVYKDKQEDIKLCPGKRVICSTRMLTELLSYSSIEFYLYNDKRR